MRGRFKPNKYWLFGLFLPGLALTVALITPRLATAATPPNYNWYCNFVVLGRQACHGYAGNVNYWTGTYPVVDSDSMMSAYNLDGLYPGATNAFPNAVDTAPEFIAEVEGYLAKTNNGTVYEYNAFGAASIVDSLLGEPGPSLCASGTCTWKDVEKYAVTHETDFETRVNYYASQGWITWNQSTFLPAQTLDTTHPCTTTPTSGSPCIDAEKAHTTSPSDKRDFVFRAESTSYTLDTIVFQNPDGSTFKIVKLCGNIVGKFKPLTSPDMNMQVDNGGLFDSAGNPAASLAPGGTYTIHPSTNNSGNTSSNIVYMELKTPSNTSNAGIDAALAPYGVTSGYSAVSNCVAGYPQVNVSGSPPAACAGPHWWWEYNNIPAGSPVIGQAATFVVSPTASGTICFQADVVHRTIANPADPANYSAASVDCYPVGSPRSPSVEGDGSDIHAGGGACDGPQYDGIIDTNPLAASLGAYVVSATDTVGSIGSNNSTSDTSLRLGPTGSYNIVCRPDLFEYAQSHMPAGASWFVPPPGAIYDLSSFPNQFDSGGGKMVAYMDGDFSVHGQLNHSLTIVERTGTVDIDNDISRLGGTDRGSTPALGIIAQNNVTIQCGCGTNRTIDAMIFSDGMIDTCYAGSFPYFPPHCDNTLTLRGFLMANDIHLHRLGVMDTTGAQPGEILIMDPTLYLNPPFGFDDSVDSVMLNGQGERSPLY